MYSLCQQLGLRVGSVTHNLTTKAAYSAKLDDLLAQAAKKNKATANLVSAAWQQQHICDSRQLTTLRCQFCGDHTDKPLL